MGVHQASRKRGSHVAKIYSAGYRKSFSSSNKDITRVFGVFVQADKGKRRFQQNIMMFTCNSASTTLTLHFLPDRPQRIVAGNNTVHTHILLSPYLCMSTAQYLMVRLHDP